MNDERVTYFAETDARNKRIKFGIKAKDRTKHVYVIGKTGMGKSTLLENMAVQDIQGGEGMVFIDPHGKTADLLLEYVPETRVKDVIYIAPFDTDFPISFNVLESVDPTKRHLVVSGLMSTFKKIWVDAWSARMEYILTNTLLALLEYPGSTLLGVNRMLSDKDYRKEVVSKINDPSVKTFWVKEFAGYTERMAAEAVPAIQNKIGQFTANPLIRNMIGQPKSSFDFREAMDRRKIIIINLSKGKIGDENMKLLGGLLVTKIYLAAMSRADVSDRVMKMLPNFYLYVDEFQNFANASFADILSEARKYKLNLTIAHQYIEQMDEIVRPAVFGNVGTMIVFRVGATDAEALEKEFAPQFTIEDLVNLGFAQIYLKLMIDGLSSAPFSAVTLPPIPHPPTSYVGQIVDSSRAQYSKPRPLVEEEIVKFHEPTKPFVPAKNNGAGASSNSASSQPAQSSQPSQSTQPSQSSQPLPASSAPVPSVFVSPPPSVQVKNDRPIMPTFSHPAKSESNGNSTGSANNHPKPSAAAKPVETHKPFANLKDVLNSVVQNGAPKGPQAQGSSQISTSDTSAIGSKATEADSTVPKTEPAKPVPLSALSKQTPKKEDSKNPTPKNVADLKNALAAAMKSTNSAVPQKEKLVISDEADSAVSQRDIESPATSIPAAPVPVPQKPIPKKEKAQTESQDSVPNEVPAEVLHKVLKVD